MPTASRPRDLSARLDAEWAALRRDPDVLSTVRRWELADRPIGDLDDFLALLGHRISTGDADNERLRAVLALARGDELAARIVLQRILPGLLAKVRDRGRARRDGVFEEVIGSAWISIRTTRHGADCRNLAAALVSDAIHRSFVAPRRRRSATELSMDPTVFEQTVVTEPRSSCEELADVIADARRAGLPDDDVSLLRDLIRTGSAKTVAEERKVTPRTIRNHRARIAHELRRTAAA